jgi:prepilin-type processing-associated H-X9-DG protein
VFQGINDQLPISVHPNDAPRETMLPIMLCPSDISEQTFELHRDETHFRSEPTSDTRSSPTTTISGSLVRLPAANYVGVFGTLEADDEFPAPLGDGPIISRRRVRFTDLERGLSHTLLVGERTTAMAPSTWLGVDFRGEDAACRLVGSAVTAPNCEVCDECEFSSRHRQGSHFAWADGHVSLVASDIDSIEYRQLAKRRNE